MFRSLLQLAFLSPRIFSMPLPANLNKRPIVLLILAANLYCLLMHGLFAPPSSRSHLHGGLTIEFVGEKPLTSRFPLLIWDSSVLILQLCLFVLNFGRTEAGGTAAAGAAAVGGGEVDTTTSDSSSSTDPDTIASEPLNAATDSELGSYSDQTPVRHIRIFQPLVDSLWSSTPSVANTDSGATSAGAASASPYGATANNSTATNNNATPLSFSDFISNLA